MLQHHFFLEKERWHTWSFVMEWESMFFVGSRAWDKEKILNPHKKLKLRN